MSSRHGIPIWYELMTLDPQASRRFYEAVVGWRIEAQPSGPVGSSMDYRMIATATGLVGGVFKLTPEMKAQGAQPCWMHYIGVDDVDRCVASITAAGGSVLLPAHDIPGVGRIAMVADPQGAASYVMRGSSEELSTAFAPEQEGHGAWHELHAADGAKATAFYCQQFGWSKSTAMDMGPGGIYQLFATGGQDLGGIMTDKDFAHPAWLIYFRVNGIDAAAGRITQAGGKVVNGPMEVPGGGWIVGGVDPQGVMFALTGPK
jgi:uncharacterized protein